ncbi:hypothetical protein ACFE04_021545 [Oxalis oulophora]
MLEELKKAPSYLQSCRQTQSQRGLPTSGIRALSKECRYFVIGQFKLNRCTYRNIYYESGEFVRTGEPCLNCTCTNGVIVCHLRVCSPIPNPPPPGCFVLHKKESCCSELFCNEDNNVIFDGLEGRSRPGANDDTEVDLENFRKSNQNKVPKKKDHFVDLAKINIMMLSICGGE